MNDLTLMMSKQYGNVTFDCYVDRENQSEDFWATREQIGQLLGYEKPNEAIAIIHHRNKERLDKFATPFNLKRVEGTRTVTREVTIYNFKGLLEICRYSNQPKANAVMDWLWNVADEIRKTGMYATSAKVDEILSDPDAFIKILQAFKTERDKNIQLETKIKDDRPKVIFADAVDASKDSILIGNLAKLAKQNGVNIGQNRLFELLRKNNYLMNCKGERWNMPTQRSLNDGLLTIKKSVINNPDGSTKITHTTKVTGKGQIYFLNLLLENKLN